MKYSSRTIYPLVFRTMIVLCFFVFPLFLLNLSMNRYYGLLERDRAAADALAARKIMAQVSRNSDNARYLHLIFTRIFEQRSMPENFADELVTRINSLKGHYPDSLEFIVWDAEGNLDKTLSANTDYNFLKKRLNIFLRELREHAVAGLSAGDLSTEHKRQVRNFREFLGPFISSSKIAESFLPGSRGSCFKMHGKGRHAWGWYTSQPGFSVMIYISHELASSLIYPELFCRQNTDPLHNYFLVNEKTWQVQPDASAEQKQRLIFNLARHSSITPPEELYSDSFLYSYQRLTPEWWLAAVTDRRLPYAERTPGRRLMVRVFAAMLVALFVLHCYFLVHANPFVSIRWKLMGIFAYTVAIPLMIFATVGFEHLAQQKSSVESRFGLELAQILMRMDLQFEVYLKQQADRVSALANSIFSRSSAGSLPQNLPERFVKDFSPLAVLLIDTEGQNRLPREFSGKAANNMLLRTLAADLLEFLNDRDLKEVKPFKVVSESMLQSHARVDRAIRIFQHSQGELYFYQYAIRLSGSSFYQYCLQLFWDKEAMQKDFFDGIARKLHGERRVEPVMYFPAGSSLASGSLVWQGSGDFFDQVIMHGLQVAKVDVAGKSFLAVGMRGQTLSDTVVAALLDSDEIAGEIDARKRELFYLLAVMVLLAGALYRILHFQILNPVNHLVKGVKKIHEGAYAYRIPFKSANELGQLSTSVNHALENLQELVIAQVVQDALLPDNLPGIAGYEIYAGTRPMTKLGGDYYDFFVNPSGELVVVMADVAGHGIQAALLMAMAKAAFMVGQTSEGTAMTIMHKLNQTFCHLRQSSVKTMLTCQVLSFLPDSGACALINAGHCPPLTISSDRQVTVHQFRTLPLGYSSSRTFEQMTITIASGDTLVLYSDGIIEALNDREEMLGQEGFVELVRASAHPDLKTFHAGMFARYDEWRAAQNDDITFVLIRRTADEN